MPRRFDAKLVLSLLAGLSGTGALTAGDLTAARSVTAQNLEKRIEAAPNDLKLRALALHMYFLD